MLTHCTRERSSLLGRLCCPCYNATIALLVSEALRVPDLVYQVGWLTPFHRRGSLWDLKSRGTELHLEVVRTPPGRGLNSMIQSLPA